MGFDLLPTPTYFVAFLAAVAVSGGLTALAATTRKEFDLGSLSRSVGRFDEPGPDAEPDGGTTSDSSNTSQE